MVINPDVPGINFFRPGSATRPSIERGTVKYENERADDNCPGKLIFRCVLYERVRRITRVTISSRKSLSNGEMFAYYERHIGSFNPEAGTPFPVPIDSRFQHAN